MEYFTKEILDFEIYYIMDDGVKLYNISTFINYYNKCHGTKSRGSYFIENTSVLNSIKKHPNYNPNIRINKDSRRIYCKQYIVNKQFDRYHQGYWVHFELLLIILGTLDPVFAYRVCRNLEEENTLNELNDMYNPNGICYFIQTPEGNIKIGKTQRTIETRLDG